MKILITGGTGFIGSQLVQRLSAAGHQLYVLLHQKKQDTINTANITYISSTDALLPDSLITGLDSIINLAGYNIGADFRWNKTIKTAILNSRISCTNLLVSSLAHCKEQGKPIPKLLINASAAGYYGTNPTELLTETSPAGKGFLASVCLQWEAAAAKAQILGVNVVILRLGIVLGPGGGVLEKMSLPFRLGLGGIIGSGAQWVPWIHRDDLINLIEEATNGNMRGVYNATAPHSSTMQNFGNTLGQALGRTCWTKMPSWLARILFGEMAEELLLCSQQVFPQALLARNFTYRYPDLESALRQIYSAVHH